MVLTSSFAAVGCSRTGGGAYDESDRTDPADDLTPYIRSKAVAERAAWDFVAAGEGGLELAAINPPGTFGPVLGTHLSASVALAKAMVLPRNFDVADVRDVAQAPLRAMT
ncbi:hypothetical protein ACH5AL_25015 [Actinacidiphila glaucinigra]|uniref:hypothetical protein n=1 Tax=Actinacidiphila glaucinigra TaxID=235986 RepID=UPI0037B7975E